MVALRKILEKLRRYAPAKRNQEKKEAEEAEEAEEEEKEAEET